MDTPCSIADPTRACADRRVYRLSHGPTNHLYRVYLCHKQCLINAGQEKGPDEWLNDA